MFDDEAVRVNAVEALMDLEKVPEAQRPLAYQYYIVLPYDEIIGGIHYHQKLMDDSEPDDGPGHIRNKFAFSRKRVP
jgi:hypothetical protein